jgi:hypothetical protein
VCMVLYGQNFSKFLCLWLLILIYQFPCILYKRIHSHIFCLSATFIEFSLISMLYFILDFSLNYDHTIFSLPTKSLIVYFYETVTPQTVSHVNHTKVHFVHILTHIQVGNFGVTMNERTLQLHSFCCQK